MILPSSIFFPTRFAILAVSYLFASPGFVGAFVAPQAFVSNDATTSSGINMLPVSMDGSLGVAEHALNAAMGIVLSDEAQAINTANSALDSLRTFFIVITALVFGFAGLTFITAAFIVPKAAEQLEQDTRRLRPGLWEEFEARLEPGQTMATRPDLLQELGNIMQPIIIADFEASAEAKANAGSVGKNDNVGGVVDTTAETVKSSEKNMKIGGSGIGGDANQWDD